jgi:hypothetical protein
MRFTKKTLKSAGLSDEAILKLRRRHVGGVSASEGFDYQRSWAVLQFALIASGSAEGTVGLEALCPVDDVVVTHKRRHAHHQVKLGSVTWTGNSGKLADEFRLQKKLMRARTGSFDLGLVTGSKRGAAALQKARPKDLKSCTTVHHHAAPPSGRYWELPAIRVALASIMADQAGLSQVEAAYALIEQALKRATGGRPVNVHRTINRLVRDGGPPFLRPALNQPLPANWKRARVQVGNVHGLKLHIHKGMCTYEHLTGSGIVGAVDRPAFARFIARVLKQKPATFQQFWAVLP